MHIFVNTALRNKTIIVDVEYGDLVSNLKEKIEEKEGIPKEEQRIIFKGIVLEDEKFLSDYNVQKSATLHCISKIKNNEKE